MNIAEINKSFKYNSVPNEMFYSPDKNEISLDVSKLTYNTYYQSYDFYANKFFNGYQNLVGMNEVIEDMANNAQIKKLTPLDEYNNKKLKFSEIT